MPTDARAATAAPPCQAALQREPEGLRTQPRRGLANVVRPDDVGALRIHVDLETGPPSMTRLLSVGQEHDDKLVPIPMEDAHLLILQEVLVRTASVELRHGKSKGMCVPPRERHDSVHGPSLLVFRDGDRTVSRLGSAAATSRPAQPIVVADLPRSSRFRLEPLSSAKSP